MPSPHKPPPDPNAAPLMRVEDVAALLRTTTKAIRHKIDRAQLAGVVRHGRRVLIRRDELIASLRCTPSPGRMTR